MDDLDRRIIMVFAENPRYVTTYEVTSKLYPGESKESIRAMRPKIRNRIVNIIRELNILDIQKDATIGYRLKDGAYVAGHCNLQVPESEQVFDVGDALVVPSENLVVVLNSWV